MTDERRCGTCKHYDKEQRSIGFCVHPVTVFMRELVRNEMVPFAFSELEVTTLMPNAGKDCPTWQAR